MVPELAMVLIATALTRFTFVQTEVSYDVYQYNLNRPFHEEDMTPEFSEQLNSHDHEADVHRISHLKHEKYELMAQKRTEGSYVVPWDKKPMQKAPETSTKGDVSNDDKKKGKNETTNEASPLPFMAETSKDDEAKKIPNDEIDVVDREDHVTQYLAELLVNTDSEITSLQASEPEDEIPQEISEDQFFAFLTGQEKVLEIDGVWSRSADVKANENYEDNLI